MICTDCQAATENLGNYKFYNHPQCVYCTVRLVRHLQVKEMPAKHLLSESKAFGHDEAKIRITLKANELTQPVIKKTKK